MKASNIKRKFKLSKAATTVILLSAVCIIIAASFFVKYHYFNKYHSKYADMHGITNEKVNENENEKKQNKSSKEELAQLQPQQQQQQQEEQTHPQLPTKPTEKPIKEIQGLVEVGSIDPSIVIDLRYATTNNFTHKIVYPVNVCVVKKTTALKLKAVNEELKKKGYKIKIYDGYRPLKVQEIFWSIVPDSRYVADPKKGGSRHNTGTAVDITLVDESGNELEMPSGFDDFTEKASRTSKNMTQKAGENMKLLTDAMTAHGFRTIQTEWWHFEDGEGNGSPILDVALEEFLQ